MSDSDVRTMLLPLVLLVGAGVALADDEDVPDMEFLEYLGMWEETDDEWLLFEEDGSELANRAGGADKRIDPAPRGKESTEQDDVE